MEEQELELKDKQKFKAVVIALQVVKGTFWFTSSKHKAIYKDVCILIDKIITYINQKS